MESGYRHPRRRYCRDNSRPQDDRDERTRQLEPGGGGVFSARDRESAKEREADTSSLAILNLTGLRHDGPVGR